MAGSVRVLPDYVGLPKEFAFEINYQVIFPRVHLVIASLPYVIYALSTASTSCTSTQCRAWYHAFVWGAITHVCTV